MGAPELELLTHVNLSRVSVSFGATAAVLHENWKKNSISSRRLKLEFVCVCVSFFPQKNWTFFVFCFGQVLADP